jgi:ABC-type multidrug transport system ATPase subunit
VSGSADPVAQRPLLSASPRHDPGAAEARSVPDHGDALVVTEGLSKAYGSTTVLRDIDLRLEPRSLVAVAGANGVGKSTLLGCLAGAIRHVGHVYLDGAPLGKATRGRVAYLPQRLRLPASSSGDEVMRLFGALAGGPDRVSLPEGFLPDLRKPLGQLSGGQAQRVALAATLRGSPDLILLDEPFANLDDDARAKAHELIRAQRDAGATVLVASPTALDLLAMIDRVLLLEAGSISFDGAPARYAGRLEMTVWVHPGDWDEERLAGLDHVLRARREGDWLALECHDDRVISLLRDLEAAGVRAEQVRLGGPTAEARLSASPGAPTEGSA